MLSPDQVDRLEDKRSKDTAAIFLGWLLIVSGCFFILFLDWDRRGGTRMMEMMFAAEVLIGLAKAFSDYEKMEEKAWRR